MSELEILLPKGWWAFELPGYRNHPALATYSLFDYKALPPIGERLDDRFDWLWQEPPHDEDSLAEISIPEEDKALQEQFAGFLDYHGLRLPASFVTFMQTPELHRRVRSCTACYLELPDYLVGTIGFEEGFLLHFLSDQQWCLHWYLYVNRSGEHGVIVSPEAYGFVLDPDKRKQARSGFASYSHRKVNPAKAKQVWLCAPSFSEFIYRFWLENELWFAISLEKRPLTARERAYVGHYSGGAS